MARTGNVGDSAGNVSAGDASVATVASAPGDSAGSTVQLDERTNPEAFAYEVEADSKSDKDNVVYNGDASVRVLTGEDWERVGAKGKDKVIWDFSNDFRVPVSEFTATQLDYLRLDGRFTVPDKK